MKELGWVAATLLLAVAAAMAAVYRGVAGPDSAWPCAGWREARRGRMARRDP